MKTNKNTRMNESSWDLARLAGHANREWDLTKKIIPIVVDFNLAEAYDCNTCEVLEDHREMVVIIENAVEDFFTYAQSLESGFDEEEIMCDRIRILTDARNIGDIVGLSRFKVLNYIALLAHRTADLLEA